MEDSCVMCGAFVPEGRMVCPMCEQAVLEREKQGKREDETF